MFFCLLARCLNDHKGINEVGFLIEVPTSFSSIENLAKKWQMANTERHPPKEIGRARPIFLL